LSSFRFNDWDYLKPKIHLPTLARGLFTTTLPDGTKTIVLRGYDKFFNIGEAEVTTWDNIEAHTTGQYTLSAKENGCILFISGLPDGELLVTSKHAVNSAHSLYGNTLLDTILESVGATRADLAAELYLHNYTAVCELCDDRFEEHILEYPPDRAGLYLHGLNVNTAQFITEPFDKVQAFAAKWGFRSTEYKTYNDIHEVRSFLDKCAENGKWNSREIEGFVVRCKRDNQHFFFKYKFEEPYFLYRQWRELTNAVIAKKDVTVKTHLEITPLYIKWVKQQLRTDPSLGERYSKNHGIIALRKQFLEALKQPDFQQTLESKILESAVTKYVIMPIATIGCGKTTIGLSLCDLFRWGHVQNDNIPQSKGPAGFHALILESLEKFPVVYADRCNHIVKQRETTIKAIREAAEAKYNVRFIAIQFHEYIGFSDAYKVISTTAQRIYARGDKHQSIQTSQMPEGAVEGLLKQFIGQYRPVAESEVDYYDLVIKLPNIEDTEGNLKTIVQQIGAACPNVIPEIPDDEHMHEAFERALNYKPDFKKVIKTKAKKLTRKRVRVYCARLETSLVPVITELLSLNKEPLEQWNALKATHRMDNIVHHVTLIHRSNMETQPDVWRFYENIEMKPSNDGQWLESELKVQFELTRIFWTDRLFTVQVKIQNDGIPYTNKYLHVTLGTHDESVRPYESNNVIENYYRNNEGSSLDVSQRKI
ncbi:hypothetical protein CANCADRAFT_17595, partial [Tortispora caseinolytica NRRL Y-17796]